VQTATSEARELDEKELTLREAASLIGRSSEWLRQRVVSGTVDARVEVRNGKRNYFFTLAGVDGIRRMLAPDLAPLSPDDQFAMQLEMANSYIHELERTVARLEAELVGTHEELEASRRQLRQFSKAIQALSAAD
jgi:hypothetical protein